MPIDDAENCPFCGNDDVDFQHWDAGAITVTCGDCDAEGPSAGTEAEALALWNDRT